jgi:hypothetical protein
MLLSSEVVARAARMLYGSANAHAIDFFTLKADGVAPDSEVTVNGGADPSPGLRAVALQPEGFAALVDANRDRFPPRAGGDILPIKPS